MQNKKAMPAHRHRFLQATDTEKSFFNSNQAN
jgi:hypothetical protein